MKRRLVVIQGIIWSLVFLTGICRDKEGPKLKVELAVDDSEPLFQGNKTKLYVNVTHDSNSSSAASHITLNLQASFKAEFSSMNFTPNSARPEVLQQNYIELKRLERHEEFSCEVHISIDPDRLTEPGRLHVAHIIVTITYSGDHDNYTDFNTGARVAKTTDHAYTSFYFYVLDSLFVQPLGMRSGHIKESQLSSSSFHKESQSSLGHSPHRARLGGLGHWSPAGGSASIDGQQFLQITFEKAIQLKMIILQGKPNSEEHVRTFDALTSLDGEDWKKEIPVRPKGFVNIKDGNTAVPTAYQSPTPKRFLRIQPRSWHKESALRVEVYGCIVEALPPTQECCPALGVEEKLITDVQMTASSTSDPLNTNASSGRLNFKGAWCSATPSEQPLFLQIDLNDIHVITAVSSQSRYSSDGSFQSVTKYKLNYSDDGAIWNIYQHNGVDKEFLGNLVEDIPTKHHLAIPAKARLIQFQPLGMISALCMRVELYGEKSTIENAGKPPVYPRSILLDAKNRRLFLCNKDFVRSKAVCFIRRYLEDESWTAMDRRIVSILGYDETKGVIYGVARNRKSYLRCKVTKCAAIAMDPWLMIRGSQTTILATEIAFLPETGHDFTDAPISEYKLTDHDGNIWAASAVGIHFFKVQTKAWTLIAHWRSRGLNKCRSGPCENGASCTGNKNDYTCFCLSGWMGKNCHIPFVVPQIKVTQFSCSLTSNKVKPGTMNTPNYPNYYGNNNHCTWLISSSHRIKLTFTYFNLETGYDFLTVYDGNSAYTRQIGKFSGYRTNQAIQSSGNHLFLKFTSDYMVTRKGFFINFAAVL